MGGALNRPGLSDCSECDLWLAKRNNDRFQALPPRSAQASEDERTVTTACLKPVFRLGPHTAEGFRRTGTRRISSWPGEIHLHTHRPDTLTQTFFLSTLFPCSHTADHTFRKLRVELADIPTLLGTTGIRSPGPNCEYDLTQTRALGQ